MSADNMNLFAFDAREFSDVIHEQVGSHFMGRLHLPEIRVLPAVGILVPVEESWVLGVGIFASSLVFDDYLAFVGEKRLHSLFKKFRWVLGLIEDDATHVGFVVVAREGQLLGDHLTYV